MTAEQKLKNLDNWMTLWIHFRVEEEFKVSRWFEFFDRFGMIMPIAADVKCPTFEYYLNWIQKNEK